MFLYKLGLHRNWQLILVVTDFENLYTGDLANMKLCPSSFCVICPLRVNLV